MSDPSNRQVQVNLQDKVVALQVALKESERMCRRFQKLYERSRRDSVPLKDTSAVDALEARLAPLRRIYRLGAVKPSSIFLTPQEFDALCDISSIFLTLVTAVRSDDKAFVTSVAREIEARFGTL